MWGDVISPFEKIRLKNKDFFPSMESFIGEFYKLSVKKRWLTRFDGKWGLDTQQQSTIARDDSGREIYKGVYQLSSSPVPKKTDEFNS